MTRNQASAPLPFFSLNEAERVGAIRELAATRSVEAARELIQIYFDCEWRSTRREILRLIPQCASQRTVEFLFQIALETKDIVLSEDATLALGRTHSPLAAAFLGNVYRHSDESLKAAAASALATIPDASFAPEIQQDLEKSQGAQNGKLVRNQILALGELKWNAALPKLRSLIDSEIARRSQPGLLLGALLAYGKISRDLSDFSRWESGFSNDALEGQIFQSVRAQVQGRAQWTLEDYLKRLFAEAEPHPALPLELLTFPMKDVLDGFELFRDEPKVKPLFFARACFALSRLAGAELSKTYDSLAGEAVADPEMARIWLESVSHHRDPKQGAKLAATAAKFEAVAFSNPAHAVFPQYLQTLALLHSDGSAAFRALFKSDAYLKLGAEAKMTVLNAATDHALCVQPFATARTQAAQLLVERLPAESDEKLQARVLRALARLRWSDQGSLSFVKAHLEKPALTASCLAYLEANPSRPGLQAIEALLSGPKSEEVRKTFGSAVFRALAAQEKLMQEWPKAAAVLESSFGAKDASEETQSQILRLLARYPFPSLLEAVHTKIKTGSPRLKLLGVVAVKAYTQEASAEVLSPLLTSTDRSLAGRALDSLCALPGLRPRRLVIDYLRDHSDDFDSCEKITRSLQPIPGIPAYFADTVAAILEKSPQHPLWEALVSLRDRLRPALNPSATGGAVSLGAEITAVEVILRQKVPAYDALDESVKTALRSAELPFARPELFTDSVDKASSVLEYCKALDLQLEKSLGRNVLFPKVERQLQDFQTVLHALGLDDESTSASEVLKATGLTETFNMDSFPLHKMRIVAHQFFTGRIVNDGFKVLDGLRAWAVILLLFTRKLPGAPTLKAPITVQGATDSQLTHLSRRLIALQEIRNPAAHRQTYLKMPAVEEVRREVLEMISSVQKWVQN